MTQICDAYMIFIINMTPWLSIWRKHMTHTHDAHWEWSHDPPSKFERSRDVPCQIFLSA